MTITFRYKRIRRPDGTEVKTPSIPILLGREEKINTIALLDSGADISAIPVAIAELIGLDLGGRKTPAFGIGGKVDSVESKMNIMLEKGHEHYTFQIPVKVIFGNYEFPVILGRLGFFDKFIVSFDQNKEKISLKRVIGK